MSIQVFEADQYIAIALCVHRSSLLGQQKYRMKVARQSMAYGQVLKSYEIAYLSSLEL